LGVLAAFQTYQQLGIPVTRIISGSNNMRSSFEENRSSTTSRVGNYLFMRPLLRRLGEGVFVYKIVSVTLRVGAALIVLGSLASFFKAGKTIFELPTTGAMFGGILFQLFYIVAIYAVAHVFIIRARDIEASEPGKIYMLPLGAILLRLAGEAYAGFVTLIAIGGGIFVWFTSKNVATILGPLNKFFPAMKDTDFMNGIAFMFSGVLIAVGVLIATYMAAEAISLLVDTRSKAAANVNNGNGSSNGNGNGNGQSSMPRPLPSRTTIKSRFGS